MGEKGGRIERLWKVGKLGRDGKERREERKNEFTKEGKRETGRRLSG